MTATTPFTEDQLQCALAQFDVEDASVTNTYSGRGMYGARCFGVTMNRGGLVGLVALAIAEASADAERLATEDGDPDVSDMLADAAEIVRTGCTDSMGLGTIVYFPGWTLPTD